MIDAEIRRLAAQPPDHVLDELEADIWAGVRERERSARSSRQLLALQALILATALIGGLVAGRYASKAPTSSLDVFSPRMPLSVSTLLVGDRS